MGKIFRSVQTIIAKRRGDCFGAFAAGFVFLWIAPYADHPFVFFSLGSPLLIIGAILSIFVVVKKIEISQ